MDPLPWQQDIIDALEKRQMRMAIDPASPEGDKTVVIVGKNAEFVIVDDLHFILASGDADFLNDAGDRRWAPVFGDHTITGTMTCEFKDEELLRRMLREAKPTQPEEFKPDNRKQRRIDEAKARHKRPRGKRRQPRMIFDIETYDPNRMKDWQR